MEHLSYAPDTEGASKNARYYQGPEEIIGDVMLSHRVYSYPAGDSLVAGSDSNVTFTIDQPARSIWPYFRDWNLWHGSHLHYSRVLGDMYDRVDCGLGEEIFRITNKPTDTVLPNKYQILKSVPERLIVWFQPVPEDGGNGGVSRGFHVFTLNEFGGKTTVTCVMHHAERTTDLTEEQALSPWRTIVSEAHRRWRDYFIPTLKRLASEQANQGQISHGSPAHDVVA